MTVFKNLKASLAVLGVLASPALISAAHAHDGDGMDSRLYVGVGAGLNEVKDSTPSNGNTYDFGTGYNIAGTVGYKVTPNIRTELEVDYRRAGMNNINGVAANGAQKTLSASANVLYDFNNSSKITPYIGGGVGIARQRWSNVNTGAGTPNINDSDHSFQWQLIGGVSTPISPRTALFVDYRYIGVADAKLNGTGGTVVADHYDHSHNVLGGVRYFF
jgi:opacity protein-like surface antigen